MIYDVIIVGAGASGLYAAAQLADMTNEYRSTHVFSVLLLEKTKRCGTKLLMSGAGQCNLTHGGSIKDFIEHYGEHGKRIRSSLYGHSNDAVMDFFERSGVHLFEREDGKVFPKSLSAAEIKDTLLNKISKAGFEIKSEAAVSNISDKDGTYLVETSESSYNCRSLIISTGGCSYASSGSDGSMFAVLEKLGLEIVSPTAALVPVHVQNYPYSELSGISFENAVLKLHGRKNVCGALLLTHNCFSGPLILDNSRYIGTGDNLTLSYIGDVDTSLLTKQLKNAAAGNKKEILNFICDFLSSNYVALPKRFTEFLITRAANICSLNISGMKAASAPGKFFETIARLLTSDSFSASGKGSFNIAMATAGGVSLDEISTKTMETKKYPHLFIIGECLDVDGDTGGYNLQFAFSSAFAAANSIIK